MPEPTYHDPHVTLSRIYTRTGDAGETSLAGGQRVGKDNLRIECFGTVDELNSLLGLARVSALEQAVLQPLAGILLRLQHELFNLGSLLATLPEDLHPRQPQVTDAEVSRLEQEIDAHNEGLPSLSSFVLPGGCRLNAELHACRTICRRAERLTVALGREQPVPAVAVRYLNRLSDALFVFARWVNQCLAVPEVLWDPNRAASGGSS